MYIEEKIYTKRELIFSRIPFTLASGFVAGLLYALIVVFFNETWRTVFGEFLIKPENQLVSQLVFWIFIVIPALYTGWKFSIHIVKGVDGYSQPYTKFTYPEENE